MADESNSVIDRIVDESSRRNFMKKGALATAGVGLATSGTATAQEEDDDDVFVNNEQAQCVMFQNDFRPGSEFVITSPVIDWSPRVPADLGTPFEGYNTRIISYRGTGDNVLFFQAQDAQVPNYNEEAGYVVDDDQTFGENEFTQPEVFSLWNDASFFEGTNRLVTATFSPTEEDFENDIWNDEDFDGDDDWLF